MVPRTNELVDSCFLLVFVFAKFVCQQTIEKHFSRKCSWYFVFKKKHRRDVEKVRNPFFVPLQETKGLFNARSNERF